MKTSKLYLAMLGALIASCNSGSSTPPTPKSCQWEELGDASTFFNNLTNDPNTGNSSPMALSADGETLYIGGAFGTPAYNEGPNGVASINTNSGTSWEPVTNSKVAIKSLDQINALALDHNNNLYVGGKNTIGEEPVLYTYNTTNGWNPIGGLPNDGDDSRIITGITYGNNNIYAAGTINDGEGFISTLNESGIVINNNTNSNRFTTIQTIIYANGLIIVAGTKWSDATMVIKSSSDGENWTDMSITQPGTIYSLVSSGNNLYAAGESSENGVILSTALDAVNWVNITPSDFISSGIVKSIASYQNILYSGGSFGGNILSTTNPTINWAEVWGANNTLNGPISNIIVSSNGTVYADGEFSQKVVKLKCE